MSGPADLVAEKGGSGDTTKKIWKKYEGKYTCPIEPTQFDRATKIDGATNAGVGVLCKCERPHMRGFHGLSRLVATPTPSSMESGPIFHHRARPTTRPQQAHGSAFS